MSFGQALFFGVAGYAIALVGRDLEFSQLWGTLPLAMLVGLVLAVAFAAFLLLGPASRRPRSSSRWARSPAPTPPSGWSRAGSMSAPATASRRSSCCSSARYEFVEGPAFYYPGAGAAARWSMPARATSCARSSAWCWPACGRTRSGWPSSATGCSSSRRWCSRFAGMIAGLARRALQLPPGLHRAGQHGPGPVDDGGDLLPVRRHRHADRPGDRHRG